MEAAPPTALLQPLSPAQKLQTLSGLLLGSAVLQNPQAWDLLKSQEDSRFAEINAAAQVSPSSLHGRGLYADVDLKKDTVAALYPVHSIGLADQRLASNADQDYWKDEQARKNTEIR